MARLKILAIILLSLTIFFGFFKNSSSLDQSIPVLRKAIYSIPDKFDPIKATSTADHRISNFIYEGLVGIDEYLQVVPEVAESINVSESGVVYSFKIRKDVKFHDGSVLSVEDALRSTKRLIASDSPTRDTFSMIEKIWNEGEVLKIQIKSPYPPFLFLLASSVAKISKESNGYHIGTGVYKFDEIQKKSLKTLVLSKFDNYRGEKGFIDKIHLMEVSESDALKYAKSGTIHDTAGFISRRIETGDILKKDEGDSAQTWLLALNQQSPKLKDKRLRRCIERSFPRTEFVKKFLPDHKEAKGYLPPGLLSSRDIKDEGKAVECKGFESLRLRLDYPEVLENGEEMCQFISKSMKFTNINCNPLKFDKLLSNITDKSAEISFLAMTLDQPDVEYFLNTFESKASFNLSNLESKTVDSLLSKARLSVDRSVRSSIYNEINQFLWDEVITVNISYPRHISYSHVCIEGLNINVLGEPYIDYRKVKKKRGCEFEEHFQGEDE